MNDETIERLSGAFTEDDTGPTIPMEYLDSAGAAIDITGYTITMQVDRPAGSPVLEKTANITDAANGLFEIGAGSDPWVAGDFVPGYSQKCTIKFVDPSGVVVHTEQFYLDVNEKLGA